MIITIALVVALILLAALAVLQLLAGFGLPLGILMNAISRSRVERATMTPTSAVLAAATLIIALG